MSARFTALILAAKRPGVVDPLAEANGTSHKCLIDMAGEPMITHVIRSLTGSHHVGTILISIEDPDVLASVPVVADGVATGQIRFVPSGGNLFTSVRDALSDDALYPALVCTADNALQTAEMVDHFCDAFLKDGCDVGVSLTPAETIWAKYPDGQRRPHKFRDGLYSNCNLFGVRTVAAIKAAKAFEGGGQFGKSKKRVLQAFGLINLILYKSALLTVRGVFRRVSGRFGVVIRPIDMPFAEAPIDVDNERTAGIARRVLAERLREAA